MEHQVLSACWNDSWFQYSPNRLNFLLGTDFAAFGGSDNAGYSVEGRWNWRRQVQHSDKGALPHW